MAGHKKISNLKDRGQIKYLSEQNTIILKTSNKKNVESTEMHGN